MGQNRSSRTYFTQNNIAPFHSGNKPSQLDFEDIFETFALKDELGSVSGAMNGWVYHNFTSIAINTTPGYMYLPIPPNAISLDRMKAFLYMNGGTNTVTMDLYLISDIDPPGGLENTTPYIPSSSPTADVRDILSQSSFFGLKLHKINFVNSAPLSTQNTGATTRKLIFESPSNAPVNLVGTEFRSLLINITLDAGNIDSKVRFIGLKFS